MAAPSLTTIKCRSCGQTIFADAATCQFCKRQTGASKTTSAGRGPDLLSSDTVDLAESINKACAIFWIVYVLIWLAGVILSKGALDQWAGRMGPATETHVLQLKAFNNVTTFLMLGIGIGLISISAGMLSKNPSSLRWAVGVSYFGSLFVSLYMIGAWGMAMESHNPVVFAYAVVMTLAAIATFATRWAAKRV